ncbi:MAG: GNAT family N-acetyltransferase, partial [Thermoanaerobaculia bacterium]
MRRPRKFASASKRACPRTCAKPRNAATPGARCVRCSTPPSGTATSRWTAIARSRAGCAMCWNCALMSPPPAPRGEGWGAGRRLAQLSPLTRALSPRSGERGLCFCTFMTQQPTLRTPRLTLRPFTLDDAPAVQRLASAYEVALNTLLIPHPYPDGAAEAWIAQHQANFDENRIHHFAIDAGELT